MRFLYSDIPSKSASTLGHSEQILVYVRSMASSRREKYPVSSDWKERVRKELLARGRGALSKLARDIGATTGQLSETLGAKSRYSRLVPLIHDNFGWAVVEPPVGGRREPTAAWDMTPPFPGSPDSGMIRYLVERADDEQRQYLLDATNMLLRAPTAEATAALKAMLRAFRTAFDPRRDLRAVVKVLLIDDNEIHRTRVERSAANDERIELVITDNMVDGMLLVGTLRPDLVVVALHLNGVEACRRIQANPDTRSSRVAITAAKTPRSLINEGKGAGAWQVIQSPIDLSLALVDLIGS